MILVLEQGQAVPEVALVIPVGDVLGLHRRVNLEVVVIADVEGLPPVPPRRTIVGHAVHHGRWVTGR